MYKIGVDIGGTAVKTGLVKDGKIIEKSSIETKAARPHIEVIKDIADEVLRILKKHNLTVKDLDGVGVGMPGSINVETGEVFYSNNIAWRKVPLGAELSRMLGNVPVKVDNDANVAGLGENLYGAGKNYDNSVLLTLGTGVGAGIVLDGKIFSGYKGAGAELGHMVIISGGEECTCGRRGCLEAYASATALIRETKKVMEQNKDTLMWKHVKSLDDVVGRTSFDAAKEGDRLAQGIVDNYINHLAEGIVNVINAFRPNAVILGGGVSNAGDFFLNPLKKLVFERAYGSVEYAPFDIVIATLGNDAGIYGASALFC